MVLKLLQMMRRQRYINVEFAAIWVPILEDDQVVTLLGSLSRSFSTSVQR